MNLNDLPPLPAKLPVLPPGLFDRWFWLATTTNLAVLVTFTLFAYRNRGDSLVLALNVITLALCLNSFWKIGRIVLGSLRQWRHVRAHYADFVGDVERLKVEWNKAIKEMEAQHDKH